MYSFKYGIYEFVGLCLYVFVLWFILYVYFYYGFDFGLRCVFEE